MKLISSLLSVILGVVELIVGLRIVLAFLGMGRDDGPSIVASVYDWSVPLVSPFEGFASPVTVGGLTLDLPAIFALVLYAVIGSLLIRVLGRR